MRAKGWRFGLLLLTGVAVTFAAPDPTSSAALYPTLDNLDAGYSWGHKPYVQVSAASAGNFLAVWSDGRADRTQAEFHESPSDDGAQLDIYASRVGSEGLPLDRRGLPLATGTTEDRFPSVASDGVDGYLVAWEEVSADGGHRIAARRVSTDAGLGATFAVTSSAAAPLRTAVSFADGRYLIVWSDGTQALARALELDGQPVAGGPLTLGAAASTAAPAAAGASGQGHLVSWERPDGKLGTARIGSAGPTVTAVPEVTPAVGSVRNPTLAASPGQWLAAFETGPANDGNVSAVRVTSAGAILDVTPFTIRGTAVPEVLPRAAFNGTDYVVVWQDGRNPAPGETDVYRSRVGTDGTVRDPSGVVVENDYAAQRRPAVACEGASCLQLWVDERSSTHALAVKSLTGTTQGPLYVVAEATHAQLRPSVSCLDGNCLVAE